MDNVTSLGQISSVGNYTTGMRPNPLTTNLNSIECLSPSAACHTITGPVSHSSNVLRALGACTVLRIFDRRRGNMEGREKRQMRREGKGRKGKEKGREGKRREGEGRGESRKEEG